MRRSALNLLGPTDVAVILIGAWRIITMLYCSMMLLIMLVDGDGLQMWTLKGLGPGSSSALWSGFFTR